MKSIVRLHGNRRSAPNRLFCRRRLASHRPHPDDTGNRAFAARAGTDDIAPGTQLTGALTTIIKPLIKAQRRAFLRQKYPIVLAVFHRQFDGSVTEQLRPRQIFDRNAAVTPGVRRKRPCGHRLAWRHRHALPFGGSARFLRRNGPRWRSGRAERKKQSMGRRQGKGPDSGRAEIHHWEDGNAELNAG